MLYFNQLGIDDFNIFKDHHEIQMILVNTKEKVAETIAKSINLDNLHYLTLHQLLFGKRT